MSRSARSPIRHDRAQLVAKRGIGGLEWIEIGQFGIAIGFERAAHLLAARVPPVEFQFVADAARQGESGRRTMGLRFVGFGGYCTCHRNPVIVSEKMVGNKASCRHVGLLRDIQRCFEASTLLLTQDRSRGLGEYGLLRLRVPTVLNIEANVFGGRKGIVERL